MPIRSFLSIFVLLLTTACTSPSRWNSPSTKSIQITVGNAANTEASASTYPDASFASFPLIQGSIVGRTKTPPILYIPVTFGSSIDLPIDEMVALIEPLATAPSDQMRAEGLVVTPTTAKLARVGTFFAERKEDEITDGAGLLDTKTGDTIFLVYFSEKSKVQGRVSTGGIEINVDLNIPKAGLHWLRFVKDKPTVWFMEVATEEVSLALSFQAK